MSKQEYNFPRQGLWWRTMGFTKCHLIGVFVTETVLGILGLISMVAAGVFATAEIDRGVVIYLFLTAACLFLIQIGVLLSSILSLLFYTGSRLQTMTHNANSQPSPGGDSLKAAPQE
ncbi:MAG: hypothetical protein ACYSWZ_18875 [Planctomycetota bacterium]|jgi:hypothetical protein